MARIFKSFRIGSKQRPAENAHRPGRFHTRVGADLVGPPETTADPARAGLPALGDEPLWAAPAFRTALRAAGLDRLQAVMQSTEGHCMRALAERENWRLELSVAGRRTVAFLKKHHVRTWWTRLRARLGLAPAGSSGREEAKNIRRLKKAGIPCMDLAAWGERLHPCGLLESFLLTPRLEGFTQLDDFLRHRFAKLGSDARRDRELRQLIARVATVTRQLHEAGFNHRDLYCCHFFIREESSGEFEIRLIDLQRVQHRKRFRRRWLVKDLAQLAYSAPRDHIKCTQKMAFVRQYFGVSKLGPEHKRIIREVLARQQAMERKLGLIA